MNAAPPDIRSRPASVPSTPRAATRRTPLITIRIGLLLLPVALAIGIIGVPGGRYIAAVAVALVFVSLIWVQLVRFRLEHRLTVSGCRICPTCEYQLADLSSRGRCPECGQDYDLAEVVELWRTWLRRDRV